MPRALEGHVRGRVRELAEVGERPAHRTHDESSDVQRVVVFGDLRYAVVGAEEMLAWLVAFREEARNRCSSAVGREFGGDVFHRACIVAHAP